MRYYYTKPDIYVPIYGQKYICNHQIYDYCTLYLINNKGLAVIQQKFDADTKTTYWTDMDPWLINVIYLNNRFPEYFKKYSDYPKNDIYPTVTIRSIMYALYMKPLKKKEKWETVFDRTQV